MYKKNSFYSLYSVIELTVFCFNKISRQTLNQKWPREKKHEIFIHADQ